MDEPSSPTGRIARLRAAAEQVSTFARREAELSGLPGQAEGPADAYRHLVGVAELSRRTGPLLAFAMAEHNEQNSWLAMMSSIFDGRTIIRTNTPAARTMDRRNNTLAVGIGARASSTEDVVRRVRSMMERSIETTGGSGRGNTPYWRESRYWSDGQSMLADWSPRNWSNIDEAPHFEQYREGIGRTGRPERESTAEGVTVQVRPHARDGHPVSGHMRSAPAN